MAITQKQIKEAKFIERLHKISCIQEGSFRLKSGKQASIYFDMRKIISHPDLFSDVVDRIYSKIKGRGDVVIGVPYAGIPYASAVSLRYHIPQLLMRKERKKYGMKQLLEGDTTNLRSCILIEDVLTTGSSVADTIMKLRGEGLHVTFICSIIDREMGSKETLNSISCPYSSLWTENDIKYLLKIQKDRPRALSLGYSIPINNPERREMVHNFTAKRLIDIVQEKQTNLIFSADITDMHKCLHIIDKVGPYVCMVKTHVDCIKDCELDWGERIHLLAKKHNFLVLEDRKYADIGNTTLLQYRNSIHKIHKWADIVTAYCVSGEGMVEALSRDNVSLLLIAELSSKGNLLTEKHQHQVLDIAKKYKKNVIGFICQHRFSDDSFLYCSPGVHLSTKTDSLGQQYNTPKKMSGLGIDLYIVGRGIYQSICPKRFAEKYREECWGKRIDEI